MVCTSMAIVADRRFLQESKIGSSPIKLQGKGDRRWCCRIGAIPSKRVLPKARSPQYMLMDSLHIILRPAMTIDGHRSQPIVVNNVY